MCNPGSAEDPEPLLFDQTTTASSQRDPAFSASDILQSMLTFKERGPRSCPVGERKTQGIKKWSQRNSKYGPIGAPDLELFVVLHHGKRDHGSSNLQAALAGSVTPCKRTTNHLPSIPSSEGDKRATHPRKRGEVGSDCCASSSRSIK